MATDTDSREFHHGLAWRLSELLQGGGRGAEGRTISFLALDPARRHFGHDWPRVTAKVHALVAATLRSFLSEGDVYSQADEFSYIILSSGRAASEFDKLMEDIATEISSRITGKGIAKELVRVIHLNADFDTERAASKVRATGAVAAAEHKEHLGNIERIISAAEDAVVAFDMGCVRHTLSPVMAMAAMATSAWLCLPTRSGEDGEALFGYAVMPPEADAVLYAELDALSAEFAATHLKEVPDRRVVVQIPVHRGTLSSKKYREMYLKICAGLLAGRKERVIFDIHGIDEGTPATRIAEYMQWLRPYGRGIAITLDPDFSTLTPFSGANALSVGIDLRGMDRDGLAEKVARFAGRAKAANLKCHAHGLSVKGLADLCLRLGVDYLDGDLIADAPPV